ncbi:MAG: hypothetical protein KTR16_12675 [Acidiferrobacterales bacterium]|nr:hypothetical protein [Acidiferrobacterales bacterium]
MRKVIQITDRGVHLCDDGTMWQIQDVPTDEGGFTETWVQLDNVPQPELKDCPQHPNKDIKTPDIVFVGEDL